MPLLNPNSIRLPEAYLLKGTLSFLVLSSTLSEPKPKLSLTPRIKLPQDHTNLMSHLENTLLGV